MSDYQQMDMPEFPKNGGKMIVTVLLSLIIIVTLWKSSVTVGAGESGVLFKTFSNGVDIENTYGEGFHIIAPWNNLFIYKCYSRFVCSVAVKILVWH